MSIVQSSGDHLTLNADGSSKNIVFQADGVQKASVSSAGLFTSTTIDATVLTGNLPAISGASLTGVTATDATKMPLAGGAFTGAVTTNSTFDGVDIATRDGVLTTTTTTANAALPKTGGAMTGAITTNSTFDGVDIATRDGVLTSTTTTANAALPKAGGAMTGAITTNSTFDGVDVAACNTTANAALPKAGGTMTGDLLTGAYKFGGDATDYLKFTDNAQLDVYVNGNNEFRFEADGDFHADADVIAYSTTVSDATLKYNINPV